MHIEKSRIASSIGSELSQYIHRSTGLLHWIFTGYPALVLKSFDSSIAPSTSDIAV